MNHGSWDFEPSDQTFSVELSAIQYALDFDGDEDLDYIAIPFTGRHLLFRNNGAGEFLEAIELDAASSYGTALGDFNGDGLMDLACASRHSPNVFDLWQQTEALTFERRAIEGFTHAPALAKECDVNHDGHLDLFIGGGLDGSGYHILLGDGHGNFSEVKQELPALTSIEVTCGDLDLDGDLDLVIGNYGQAPNEILVNDGEGRFAHTQWLSTTHAKPELSDLDGDGDLDIVEPDYVSSPQGNGKSKIWLNQSRQRTNNR